MKVLFFTNQVLWGHHYFAILELMQKHIDLGNEVVQVVCDSSVRSCEMNVDESLDICKQCICSRINGYGLIDKEIRRIYIKNYFRDDNSNIKLNGGIKSLVIENFQIGLAILSTIYTLKKTTIVDEPTLNDWAVKLGSSGRKAYEAFKNILKTEKPELAITFNGRMLLSRAFISACEYMGIDYTTIDYGSSTNHLIEYMNTTPHDIEYVTKNIIDQWNLSTDTVDLKVKLAENYFALRRYGGSARWMSFVRRQIENKLPENWKSENQNIVIFISSLDEVAASRAEWQRGLFNSQQEGLDFIRESFCKTENIHFYIRLHPNLHNKDRNLVEYFIDYFNRNTSGNLSLILPDSDISSYALIESCEKTICFGSTTGVEATFYNKPSITLAPFYYQHLNVSYFPTSKSELIDLILKEIEPKPIHGAHMYAYYFITFGTLFKYFKVAGDDLYFRDKRIHARNRFRLEVLHRLSVLIKHNLLTIAR